MKHLWSYVVCAVAVCGAPGCSSSTTPPDLGFIYNQAAMHHGPLRNPVVVIPGILGSKLSHDSGVGVWGAYSGNYANPEAPEGARLFALPFVADGAAWPAEDGVLPTGALDTLKVNLLGIPLSLGAYVNVLRTLGVGGYRDQQLAEAGAIDYGSDHYSCFQFSYDWRRSNVWNAKRLHKFLVETKAYVEEQNRVRFGDTAPVKFDLIAHSMGGLLTRYYLRYGDADLTPAGEEPMPTWAGAELVERAVLVGTPSGGSVNALLELTQGVQLAPLLPEYSPAVVGTLEAPYELLPRSRHARVLGADGKPVADLFDPEVWIANRWGLADPEQDSGLSELLPDAASSEARRAIALAHLRRALGNAQRFQQALDVPAAPPAGLDLYLVAGDSVETANTVQVDADGELTIESSAPGDGTVTRASALMDERLGRADYTPWLESPVHWRQVNFVFNDHLGMTKDPAFTDNLLYLLLEAPRPPRPAAPEPAKQPR